MSEDDSQEASAQEDGENEPSMEDILASIRRILSEDEEEGEGDAAKEAAPEPSPESKPEPAGETEPEPAGESEPEPEPEPEEEMDMAAAMAEQEENPAPAPEAAKEPEPEEVMDLTADMIEPEPAPPEPVQEPAPEPAPAPPPLRAPASLGGPDIISKPTAQAATDVLTELARAMLDQRDLAVGDRGVTLEDMIRSMLRPLLREWLDRNLPYLIERLVKKEIDHMVNRAERLD